MVDGIVISKLPENLQPIFNRMANEFDITTKLRSAHFLSQASHESNDFKTTEENLNYSATGLMKTFPKYFPEKTGAIIYARHPEAIASRVYARRYGNGSEESKDGWKYRGRGFLQITFRDNYQKLSDYFGVDFVNNPDLLLTPEWAMRSAGWFWDSRRLNQIADKGTQDEVVIEITKKINGGLNGLEDRLDRFANFYVST